MKVNNNIILNLMKHIYQVLIYFNHSRKFKVSRKLFESKIRIKLEYEM